MLHPFLFLATFFTIYFLLHLYLYRRLPKRHPLIGLILILAFLSPLFIRLGDHYLPARISFIISFSALFWMGFLLYFVLIDLLLRPFTKRLISSFLLALLFSLYSYYETLRPEILYITFHTAKLPYDRKSFKILQISDLHLGPVMGLDKIEIVKKVVTKYQPDLIVSTGDLVDGNMENKAYLKEALKEIKAPYEKFAILGNHEYYRGFEKALKFTEEAGFKVLLSESTEIENFLIVVGLEDKTCQFFKKCKGPLKESEVLKGLPREKFILLLKHQPELDPQAFGLYDLMLSGHTHGGLYYPFGEIILKVFFNLQPRGLHALPQGSYLVVSKGLGTGGPPMRFLSPPDLALIELKADKGSSLPSLQVLSDPL